LRFRATALSNVAMQMIKFCVVALFAAGLLSLPAQATTALQSLPVAEGVVSNHVKGKLIWIRSLEGPGVDRHRWSYLFFDPYADSNGRLVVVRDGAVSKIDQGLVELDHFRVLPYEDSEILGLNRIKLDSDRALAAVVAAGHIENVPLSTVHYTLEMSDENSVPVWSLKLYCLRNDNEIECGHARVSAVTGQIFDLKIDHARLP
jgi:hypothetical protein